MYVSGLLEILLARDIPFSCAIIEVDEINGVGEPKWWHFFNRDLKKCFLTVRICTRGLWF